MSKINDFRKKYYLSFFTNEDFVIVDKDAYYMDLAQQVAELSACDRLKAGCVILCANDVPAFGTNMIPGQNKCELCIKHHNHCVPAIHAEISAIGQVARIEELTTKNATVYLTHAPCYNCALALIAAGVSRIVYKWDYVDDRGDQHELMRNYGIKVETY